ncbi:MAG: FprA family A-type flavoprotein [Eubacteriaceae bacterium]|nr:FprA family A-type flavoprotein [Eubacteriaceae bacterium]
MHNIQKITDDIYWVGGMDRRLERFENMFPLPNGVAYNSYLIIDEKTVLMDTVDTSITQQFFQNVVHVLGDRKLDFMVINHMEPDHCANIGEIVMRYPEVKIVGNAKTFQFIEQYYSEGYKNNYYQVRDSDELPLGKHVLKFYFAPMVHWPEVMFTYEETESILFSADAFGTFGAFAGNIFADQVDFDHVYLDESRRYYSNIVGKYGIQVQSILKKVSVNEIKIICPLHGPIWRENISYIIDKHDKWSRYEPEKKGVLLVYATMYGNTENAMNIIAGKLAAKGVTDMRMYDVSKTHPSYIIADAWKYSHLVFGSPTYNNGLYYQMESLLKEMAALQLQNRKFSLVGNFTWACQSIKVMTEILTGMKDFELIGQPFELKSSLKPENEKALEQLAEDIFMSLSK